MFPEMFPEFKISNQRCNIRDKYKLVNTLGVGTKTQLLKHGNESQRLSPETHKIDPEHQTPEIGVPINFDPRG